MNITSITGYTPNRQAYNFGVKSRYSKQTLEKQIELKRNGIEAIRAERNEIFEILKIIDPFSFSYKNYSASYDELGDKLHKECEELGELEKKLSEQENVKVSPFIKEYCALSDKDLKALNKNCPNYLNINVDDHISYSKNNWRVAHFNVSLDGKKPAIVGKLNIFLHNSDIRTNKRGFMEEVKRIINMYSKQ